MLRAEKRDMAQSPGLSKRGRAAQSSSATEAPNQRQIMVKGLSPDAATLWWCRCPGHVLLWHESCFQSGSYRCLTWPVESGSGCFGWVWSQRPAWCISMLVLASSAVLMSCWCPLWKEEQKPCCPATGEGCWRRPCSWNQLLQETWKHLWIELSKYYSLLKWKWQLVCLCHRISFHFFCFALGDSWKIIR